VRVLREPFPPVISEGSVVTIGKFDGVHIGHRAVIGTVVERATERGLESVVVTFDRNPLQVVRPDQCPRSIIALERRIELFEETGVDVVVVLRFDADRAGQAPEDFVREVLVERLGVKEILVGRDFRFGARGAGDLDLLARLGAEAGFTVQAVEDVKAADAIRVSSSRIRELIGDGRVAQAAELLGSLPAITGVVVHGHARGRDLGFPTANLAMDAVGIIPAPGVYAGYAVVDHERLPAAISVSDNPTFDDVDGIRVEAYILDADLDLYDRTVTVEFAERVRGIERFDSIDALIAAMHADVARVRALLAER